MKLSKVLGLIGMVVLIGVAAWLVTRSKRPIPAVPIGKPVTISAPLDRKSVV